MINRIQNKKISSYNKRVFTVYLLYTYKYKHMHVYI